MLRHSFFSPRRWVALTLVALGAVTAVSFVRAANTVTFQPGSAIPIRGIPMNQRPVGNSFSLPGPIFFGGYPQPQQVMPGKPTPPRNLANGQTPQFFTLGGGGTQGQQGALGQQGQGALGGQGGIQGGQQGISGGIQGGQQGIGGGAQGGVGGFSGGVGGGIGGMGVSGAGLSIAGQNFQNPTGNLGFPQVPNPQAYIGGFAGGGITGTGIAGQAGFNGAGGGGQLGGFTGTQGQGGGQGGLGGGFGGGGIGGKGIGFAGGNGV